MDYFLLAPPSADKLMNMMWTMQGRFWDFFNGGNGDTISNGVKYLAHFNHRRSGHQIYFWLVLNAAYSYPDMHLTLRLGDRGQGTDFWMEAARPPGAPLDPPLSARHHVTVWKMLTVWKMWTCYAEYKALFSKFDRDGNDSIEPSELGDALRYIGCNPLDSEVEAMVAEADSKCKYVNCQYNKLVCK